MTFLVFLSPALSLPGVARMLIFLIIVRVLDFKATVALRRQNGNEENSNTTQIIIIAETQLFFLSKCPIVLIPAFSWFSNFWKMLIMTIFPMFFLTDFMEKWLFQRYLFQHLHWCVLFWPHTTVVNRNFPYNSHWIQMVRAFWLWHLFPLIFRADLAGCASGLFLPLHLSFSEILPLAKEGWPI